MRPFLVRGEGVGVCLPAVSTQGCVEEEEGKEGAIFAHASRPALTNTSLTIPLPPSPHAQMIGATGHLTARQRKLP